MHLRFVSLDFQMVYTHLQLPSVDYPSHHEFSFLVNPWLDSWYLIYLYIWTYNQTYSHTGLPDTLVAHCLFISLHKLGLK